MVKCDVLMGILADKSIRKARITARDGLSDEDAEQRINAQKKDSFYKENCDFVVYNNSGEFDVDAILKRITKYIEKEVTAK